MDLRIGQAERPLKGEDAILRNDELRLYGVLDGLSGHGSGDIAAQTSCVTIEAYFLEHTPNTVDKSQQVAKEAFHSAQKALQNRVARLAVSRSMATTVSILYFMGSSREQELVIFGHIGDCRIYYLDYLPKPNISQVTNDEATKYGLTNVLSANSAHCYQMGRLSIRPGSRFVICSDGVYGWEKWPLSGRFQQALCTPDPQVAAERLVESSSIVDDKSVLVIDCR